MNQLAEDTAIATGAFAQSTVVPIDNEAAPTLTAQDPPSACDPPIVDQWIRYQEAFELLRIARRLTIQCHPLLRSHRDDRIHP
jgi:hypothetical protein